MVSRCRASLRVPVGGCQGGVLQQHCRLGTSRLLPGRVHQVSLCPPPLYFSSSMCLDWAKGKPVMADWAGLTDAVLLQVLRPGHVCIRCQVWQVHRGTRQETGVGLRAIPAPRWGSRGMPASSLVAYLHACFVPGRVFPLSGWLRL